VGLAAGICVVRDHEAIASVLDPVYEALGVPFDPATVGSVRRALGREVEPREVCLALERELAGPDAAVERLASLDADGA
jgi:hypothetical protein